MATDKPKNKAAQDLEPAGTVRQGRRPMFVPFTEEEKRNREAAKALGSLGGRAGKGAAKRRSAEHYKRMVAARAEQRKARAEEESINWTEDAGHENGNYANTCIFCHRQFIGHKRRVSCKACQTAQPT